jgi:hypothetical protein
MVIKWLGRRRGVCCGDRGFIEVRVRNEILVEQIDQQPIARLERVESQTGQTYEHPWSLLLSSCSRLSHTSNVGKERWGEVNHLGRNDRTLAGFDI